MANLSERRGTNCTDAEWDEYLEMGIVLSNETPTDWMKRIRERLTYFREMISYLIIAKNILKLGS